MDGCSNMKEQGVSVRWWLIAALLLLTINACATFSFWLWKLLRVHALDFGEPCVCNLVMWWKNGKLPYTWLNELPALKNPYGPVYEWLCCVLPSANFNPYFAGRLLSLLSVMLIVVLCILWICRKVNDHMIATLVGLMVLSSKPFSEWVPLMRVDMLATLFSLCGFLIALSSKNKLSVLIGVLFLVLAFHTKFTAISSLAACLMTLWLIRRKRDAVYAAAIWVAFSGAICIWLSCQTNGAYPFATQIGNEPSKWGKIFDMATRPLTTTPFWIAANAYAIKQMNNLRHFVPELTYTIVGLTMASLLAANPGSSWNYLLDFYVGLALLTGAVIGRANRSGTLSKVIAILILTQVILSSLQVTYSFRREIQRLKSYQVQYEVAINKLAPLLNDGKQVVIVSSMAGIDAILHFGKPNLVSLDIPARFLDNVLRLLRDAKRNGEVDAIIFDKDLSCIGKEIHNLKRTHDIKQDLRS